MKLNFQTTFNLISNGETKKIINLKKNDLKKKTQVNPPDPWPKLLDQ